MVKVKCNNCNYGPCKLDMENLHEFSAIPHGCVYPKNGKSSKWFASTDQPSNKVVEDGPATKLVVSNCVVYDNPEVCPTCGKYTPAT